MDDAEAFERLGEVMALAADAERRRLEASAFFEAMRPMREQCRYSVRNLVYDPNLDLVGARLLAACRAGCGAGS